MKKPKRPDPLIIHTDNGPQRVGITPFEYYAFWVMVIVFIAMYLAGPVYWVLTKFGILTPVD